MLKRRSCYPHLFPPNSSRGIEAATLYAADRTIPVDDDAHGRALGIPRPQLQSVQEHAALQNAAQGAVSVRRGNGPAQRGADWR